MPRGVAINPGERSRKISEKRKLQIPPMTGKKHSEETLKKMSELAKIRGVSAAFLVKAKEHSDARKGKPPWNKGVSAWWVKGEKSHFWKGGLTDSALKRIQTIEWHQIRKEIYKRDNWTCQNCESKCHKRGEIQCHHIIPHRICQKDDLRNLITLCVKCHTKVERLNNWIEGRGLNEQR